MKKENKGSKSKYTLFTLIVCVIAVLSGKPISEVISDVSSMNESTSYEQTYEDYEEVEWADDTLQDTASYTYEEEMEAAPETAQAKEETHAAAENKEETTDNSQTETSKQEEVSEEVKTEASKQEEVIDEEPEFVEEAEISDHTFRSKKLLNDHYKKHGLEMGFDSPEEYVENANRVISSPDVLYKLEEEDNDHVYYLEETNEFVVVSQDGYIRTYFNPSAGIDYFNRQ